MTKWSRWTDREIAELFALRAQDANWDDIALALRRTSAACQMAFSKRRPAGTAKKRRSAPLSVPRQSSLPAPPSIPIVQAPATAPGARRVSTAVLIADAELRARIALQGLTAGLLGDPLPGRSALDRRRADGHG